MDDLIAHLYNSFDPLKPATEREYLETASVRGNEALSGYFISRLVVSEVYLSLPLSGHIGGGKSSELRHLAACLRGHHALSLGKRYLPVELDVLDYFDQFTASTAEILLAIVSELGYVLRSDPELLVELKDGLLSRRLQELKQFFLSDVEVPGGEMTISGVKALFRFLRHDPKRRGQVRAALEREPGEFLDAVNSVVQEARVAAKLKGFEDLVILVDSLDKIEKTPTQEDRAAAHRSLFLDSAYVFSDLKVHKMLTVPLSFVRSHGPQMMMRYRLPAFVLPLVKVEHRGRGHGMYAEGYEAMRNLVQRRIAPHDIDTVFDHTALSHMIRYSGGHPRLLMLFVMDALVRSERLPVEMRAARYAVRGTVQTMVPAVHMAWWPKLAALELEPRQQVYEEDPDIQRMLEETMILEYLNGEAAEGDFEESAPWYAVHPILREMQTFKSAVDALERVRNELPRNEPDDGA